MGVAPVDADGAGAGGGATGSLGCCCSVANSLSAGGAARAAAELDVGASAGVEVGAADGAVEFRGRNGWVGVSVDRSAAPAEAMGGGDTK